MSKINTSGEPTTQSKGNFDPSLDRRLKIALFIRQFLDKNNAIVSQIGHVKQFIRARYDPGKLNCARRTVRVGKIVIFKKIFTEEKTKGKN